MAQPQVEGKWEGGDKDSRLYWKVRGEKQREIRARYDRLKPFLNERSRRLWGQLSRKLCLTRCSALPTNSTIQCWMCVKPEKILD